MDSSRELNSKSILSIHLPSPVLTILRDIIKTQFDTSTCSHSCIVSDYLHHMVVWNPCKSRIRWDNNIIEIGQIPSRMIALEFLLEVQMGFFIASLQGYLLEAIGMLL